MADDPQGREDTHEGGHEDAREGAGREPRRDRRISVSVVIVSALIGLAVILLVQRLAERARGPEDPEAGPGERVVSETGIPAPPPLPPLELHPADEPLTVTIRDASVRTTEGHTVEIPLARFLIEVGDEPGEPLIRVLQALVDRPVIAMVPGAEADDALAEAGPAPVATGRIDAGGLPHIIVERLAVRDGVLGEAAPSGAPGGAWAYLWQDVDLLLRDVVLGGPGPETFAFDLSVAGQVGGRTVRVESVRGAASRRGADGPVVFEGEVRVGATVVAARGQVRPDGALELEVQADTLAFPDLQGFLEIIPEEGGGAGRVRITRTADSMVVELLDAAATVAGYRMQARGRAVAMEDGDVVVNAELTRASEGGLSRLTVRGTVGGGEERRVDLDVAAVPVLIADSMIHGRFRIVGPMDSLSVGGVLALLREPVPTTPLPPGRAPMLPAPPPPDAPSARQPVVAAVDARVVGLGEEDGDGVPRVVGSITLAADPAGLGLNPGPPIRGRLTGSTGLGPDGALDGVVHLEPVPLAVLPVPDAIEAVRGEAVGELRVTGTLEDPMIEGALHLSGGGAIVRATGMEISELQGAVRLADGTLTLDGITARAGGGAIRVGGTVVPDGAVALRAELDSVRVLDEREALLELDADLSVAGTTDAPTIRGRARPTGWIRETYLESPPGLDLDDPPYADLAATVPWPERSRLRAAGAADTTEHPDEADTARDPLDGLDAEVLVDVTPEFRIIDEDSELRGMGVVVVRSGPEGVTAGGTIGLEDGFYQSFGARFDIAGGAILFEGADLEPRVAVRAQYRDDAPLLGDDEALTAPERFPPLEFFGYGPVSATVEQMRRASLLPAGQLGLAEMLLLDVDPQPVTGWRHPRFWRSDEGPELVAERAETQLVPLLWSYIADEAYDYVPLSAGYIRAGVITVGSRYPARVVVGPVLRAVGILGNDMEVRLSQPFLGGVAPGLAAVYRLGGLRLEGFTEPRFYAAPALGPAHPGYTTRRRTGIGIRWSTGY